MMKTKRMYERSYSYDSNDSTDFEFKKKKSSYSVLNNLSIHKNNYHIIEDYLRYYLLTSKELIPKCYVIVLSGIMKKRVINAKNSKINGFDARHAKANILSLMSIVLYYDNLLFHYGESFIKDSDVVNDLLKIYNYYNNYVNDFIQKNEKSYVSNVKKSLSIFDKINSDLNKSYSNDDYQYKYCLEWINKLTNYFFTDSISEKSTIVMDIYKDYYIQSFLTKYNKNDMVHYSFFKLSISELNNEYKNQNIEFYIDE